MAYLIHFRNMDQTRPLFVYIRSFLNTMPNIVKTQDILGSGCGSVGRAVASNSRGPQFESSHWQKFILNIYCQLYWKDENKEKEDGIGTFKKIRSFGVYMIDHALTVPFMFASFQFTCRFCGQSFAEKRTLEKHERRHTGEKPYKVKGRSN